MATVMGRLWRRDVGANPRLLHVLVDQPEGPHVLEFALAGVGEGAAHP